MKRYFLLGAAVSSLALGIACSSTPTTDDGGTDAALQNDTSTPIDSSSPNDSSTPKDSGTSDSTTSDASDASSGDFTLTINNYIGWCGVKINNGTQNNNSVQTYQIPANSSVTGHADTNNANAFYWGYWGNVAADGGLADGGEDLSMNITFTMTSNLTLNACCPDNGQPLTQCHF